MMMLFSFSTTLNFRFEFSPIFRPADRIASSHDDTASDVTSSLFARDLQCSRLTQILIMSTPARRRLMRDFKRQGFHLFHSDELLMQVLRIEMYTSDISTHHLKLLSCVLEFFMFVFQCCVFVSLLDFKKIHQQELVVLHLKIIL